MTQLGELLAALHGASEVRTVRATIRTWTHHARRREAFLANAENVVTAIAISDRPVPVESERVERVWRAFPDLARVRPWPLVSALRFSPLGEAERAGRPVLLARTVPVDLDPRPWPPWPLPSGADEHLLAVDRERGALLDLVSRRGGEDFERVSVEEVAYDEPLDDDLFVFRAPDGTAPAPPDHEQIDWRTTVRDVAARLEPVREAR